MTLAYWQLAVAAIAMFVIGYVTACARIAAAHRRRNLSAGERARRLSKIGR